MKKIKLSVFILLLIFAATGCFMKMDLHAATLFEIKLSVKSNYHVKVNWAKQSVSKYTILRATVSKKGKIGKYKKIATVSGKKTSYMDKKTAKNKTYSYIVKGYKKGKLKYKSYDEQEYTGLTKASWDEYSYTDGMYSTSYIELYDGRILGGMTPDGIRIYRRETGTKSFKLIKTIKSHKRTFTYKDTKVSAGKSYDYRFRAYKKVTYKKKKKTVYGSYSAVMTKKAVNYGGNYDVKVTAPSAADSGCIDIMITSKAYNGDLQFSSSQYPQFEELNDGNWLKSLKLIRYSYDGTKWYGYIANSKPYLYAGSSIHLLCSVETDGDIQDIGKYVDAITFNTYYEKIPYKMYFGPTESSAHMDIDSEMIH